MTHKKLVLINAVDRTTTNEEFFLPLSRIMAFQPIGLGFLAAATPKHWDVEIVDENYEDFEDSDADIVGVSAYSTSINRAIEISQKLCAKGQTVILGGKHATLFPEESQKYFTSVVAGEAETIWGQVINDFENNRLKTLYEGSQFPLKDVPVPRRDIFDKYDYRIATVQFARGCAYNCDFCGVPVLYNHKYRQRETDDVIQELKEIKQKYVFLVDDNIVCNNPEHRKKILELFDKIVENKINKYFMCAATINIVDDDELLERAKCAGVKVLYVGIESEKTNVLHSVNKSSNYKQVTDYYKKALKKIHKYKISVMAGFICGFDEDTKEDVEARVKYIRKSAVDFFTFTFITPLPRTKLYEFYEKEDRLLYKNFPKDWIYYNSCNVPIKTLREDYKVMSEVYYHSALNLVQVKTLLRKLFWTILRTRSFRTANVLLVYETKMHVYFSSHWLVKLLVKY